MVKYESFKSLIVSKPVFVAKNGKVPEDSIDALQSMHKQFIWNEKTSKIKQSTSLGEYTHGALKCIDIRSNWAKV